MQRNMTAVTKEKEMGDPENLSGIISEFIAGADAAKRWAKRWKCKATLLGGAAWAFSGEDGKIKIVGSIEPVAETAIRARKLYDGLEWALRCGTDLVVAAGDKFIKIEHTNLIDVSSSWVPYVVEDAVKIDLKSLFAAKAALSGG